ncbi:hypothetical protein Tco_0682485 [Tanacetum coccineum]|uniref:Reverse transcriptase domain-containing protein n=1 Tax=Tanacetum coccineum TaxID=301880 RepID=A0ABQ4XR99_9ASTR
MERNNGVGAYPVREGSRGESSSTKRWAQIKAHLFARGGGGGGRSRGSWLKGHGCGEQEKRTRTKPRGVIVQERSVEGEHKVIEIVDGYNSGEPNNESGDGWRRDFIILQMEEDDRVPLILGRPFLHTADAIIRVKNKELNLGIREDKETFHIDNAMQHSHVNDDTCFRMDVIDEITEDELDALLDDSKPFLNTSKKISETPLDKEFNEFIQECSRDDVKDAFED